MKVVIAFTFCGDIVRKSEFMTVENSGIFSLSLWPPCVRCVNDLRWWS